MEPDNNTNGWFKRLKSGLSKSSNRVVTGISALFTEKKLDDVTLEELEDLLITSDLGVAAASEMTRTLAAKKFATAVGGVTPRGRKTYCCYRLRGGPFSKEREGRPWTCPNPGSLPKLLQKTFKNHDDSKHIIKEQRKPSQIPNIQRIVQFSA